MPFKRNNATRNSNVIPGDDFRDVVDLPGWQNQSIWGYDSGIQSFFAQLQRNENTSDIPDLWLNGIEERFRWPGCLVVRTVETTEIDPLTVATAFGLNADDSPTAPLSVVTAALNEIGEQPLSNPYLEGQREALLWLLGRAETCPGSAWPWTAGIPSRPIINAEMLMANGAIYLKGANRIATGVEEVLFNALNNNFDI